MMLLTYRNRVPFDVYTLINNTTNAHNDNGTTLAGYDVANVFICPNCIKKYNLYNETNTSVLTINKQISQIQKGDIENKYICYVNNCMSYFASEYILPLDQCQLQSDDMLSDDMLADNIQPSDNPLWHFAMTFCEKVSCQECPACETRTIYEKEMLHEPCVTNLYRWIIMQANQITNLSTKG